MVRHVMIIDDDLEFLGELKELLVLSGYEVTTAMDAVIAAAIAVQARPDVILLDLKMDVMSGFDVLETLKSRAETRDIPVIVISGFISEERDGPLLRYFSVVHYLQKPFTPLTVVTQIEAATRGKGMCQLDERRRREYDSVKE